VIHPSPSHDKLGKVRWVLSDFVRLSRSLYNLEKFITCDKIMVAYRGHYSNVWQYMPAKSTKYGLKFWAVVYNPSHYIYNLIPYLGPNGQPEKGQGEQVVRNLTRGLDRKGHMVVCDNFFTASSLYKHLYNWGIYAAGTLKEIRIGVPTTLLC
jgi:hypothetical protein